MTITADRGRQAPLVAHMPFVLADMTDDTYVPMIDLPVGAIVIGGYLAITTLFNSGTDDKFSIGDQETGGSADKTEYAALSADIAATGQAAAVVPNGKEYTVGGTVGVVWNGSGTAPDAGAGILVVEYIIDGRASEVQP